MYVTLSDLVKKISTIETNMSRPQKITNTAKKIETSLASSFRTCSSLARQAGAESGLITLASVRGFAEESKHNNLRVRK
ncbi:hypothetical protein NC653_020189 [Populus alba x Populus x berolinensis]|uniref:Uncharacterized protein n=1 Tax=Populus alba x Populus x berolinensis TaxID=444605 RepID=A0AAD6MJQ5_9ROSI|nr:hypothetical protein NC653_020189 [Populus alba x Populus x berolinensis]